MSFFEYSSNISTETKRPNPSNSLIPIALSLVHKYILLFLELLEIRHIPFFLLTKSSLFAACEKMIIRRI